MPASGSAGAASGGAGGGRAAAADPAPPADPTDPADPDPASATFVVVDLWVTAMIATVTNTAASAPATMNTTLLPPRCGMTALGCIVPVGVWRAAPMLAIAGTGVALFA